MHVSDACVPNRLTFQHFNVSKSHIDHAIAVFSLVFINCKFVFYFLKFQWEIAASHKYKRTRHFIAISTTIKLVFNTDVFLLFHFFSFQI